MKTDGFSRGRGESVFYFICGGGGGNDNKCGFKIYFAVKLIIGRQC